MVEEEAFKCPFCGAPYRMLIPTGVVQVKCYYCGATVLVPPRLGGVVQRCPNHPDVLAVGLCNDCGESYCDRCLYICRVRDGKLHVCSKCYRNRNNTKRTLAFFCGVLSIIFFMLSLGQLIVPSSSAVGRPWQGIVSGMISAFTFFALLIAIRSDIKKKPLSIHDAPTQVAHTPKAFLKKCVKCGREIPIASEDCPDCGTIQPEYVEP